MHFGDDRRARVTRRLAICAHGCGRIPRKPRDSSTAKKKPHISPLATEGPKPEPITPPKPEEITSAINRGIKFLLADQRPDGSWGSPENTKGLNIYAPPPGAHDAFHTAVTSLVIMALIEAEPKLPRKDRADVNKAIDRGAAWLDGAYRPSCAAPPAMHSTTCGAIRTRFKRSSSCTSARRRSRTPGQVKELAQSQADMLARYSFVGGGWSYYDFLAGTQTPGDAAFSFTHRHRPDRAQQAEVDRRRRSPNGSRRRRSPRSFASRSPTSATPTANTCG